MNTDGSPDGSRSAKGRRAWIFAAVCGLAALAVAVSVTRALRDRRDAGPSSAASQTASALPAPPARPFIMFRSLIPGETWSHVGLAPLASPDGARYLTSMACETVYFAGSRGVCLGIEEAPLPTYYASVFDERFQPLFKMALTGSPSRVRVSPDGRRAAVTVFEHGHSYAEDGFSTRTTLLDTSTGTSLGSLEQFAVSRDGRRFHKVDFNFWGVTFARDGRRFFATLNSGGTPYLIEGNVDDRTARVVASGVECPSLSPDNTRIVFKKRIPSGLTWEWRLWILDLATLAERPLGETRSINDQVDWLDDTHVVYQDSSTEGTNLWTVGTEGTEGPSRFVRNAFSPAVVR